MIKTVEFEQTTEGLIGKVNGKLKWFIRQSPATAQYGIYGIYEVVDDRCNGCILKEIGDSLQKAKDYIYNQELKGCTI